jgi:hypothetical protein
VVETRLVWRPEVVEVKEGVERNPPMLNSYRNPPVVDNKERVDVYPEDARPLIVELKLLASLRKIPPVVETKLPCRPPVVETKLPCRPPVVETKLPCRPPVVETKLVWRPEVVEVKAVVERNPAVLNSYRKPAVVDNKLSPVAPVALIVTTPVPPTGESVMLVPASNCVTPPPPPPPAPPVINCPLRSKV